MKLFGDIFCNTMKIFLWQCRRYNHIIKGKRLKIRTFATQIKNHILQDEKVFSIRIAGRGYGCLRQ